MRIVVDSAVRKNVIDTELDEEVPEVGTTPAPQQAQRTLDGLALHAVDVDDFADYRGVTFTHDVILRDVRFSRGFSFAGATFQGRVRFFGVMNERAAGSVADFKGARFHGSAIFNHKSALYLANFQDAQFGDTTKFKGCRFYASAQFEGAVFSSSANFKDATFNGSGNFSRARFESVADFDDAVFRYPLSHARFMSTRFCGPAHFNDVKFCGNADFTEAVFSQGATFHQARFDLRQKEPDAEAFATERSESDQADVFVCFDRCTFHADEDGQVVTFEYAKFGDRNFRREITFDGAFFRPSIGPSARRPEANFQRAVFLGDTSFNEAQFSQQVCANFSRPI